jgi:hypothetical protein
MCASASTAGTLGNCSALACGNNTSDDHPNAITCANTNGYAHSYVGNHCQDMGKR